MTAKIPTIKVYNRKVPIENGTGEAGKIAVIGAFDSTITDPALFTDYASAKAVLKDSEGFDGCDCLPYLFQNGATSVLAVNITTWSEDSTPVASKTITSEKLSAALAKIKGEDWDILFICAAMTDAFIAIIDAYLNATFEMKCPAGFVAALTAQTDQANITTAGLAGDHCYGLINQRFTVNGVQLSIVKSAAWYCGLLAGMSVGNTMTMKTLPGVTKVQPELSFESGGNGKALLEAGITTARCVNRNVGRHIVVNSEQPNGLDLYINRVRDYVVKNIALHDFLGERNRTATLEEIKQEVARVRYECVNTLDLCKDIVYTVEKKSADTVDIHITSLLFDGIITEIDLYITVEVE